MRATVGILALALSVTASSLLAQDVEIPHEKFVLDNGLTVIVHEDHKAPIVAINLWYHVGSKDEVVGKTGFAHLFEHLMFNGSENYNDDYFAVLEPLGATDLNGTTNPDRTNYFQNVPTSAVDVALWMESDRMGHLLGAVDQERLDEQRGVVQNEKRQGENQPYGMTRTIFAQNTYPAGHPYSWTTIGSMEDLEAASLEDVHEWFQKYYGPNNAVLVIAGDIDVATARAKAEQYFGDIPPGPPVAKQRVWIAKRTGTHRQVMQDRVPQSRVTKIWNIPEFKSAEARYLDLVTDVLASGKTSRLYRRLVYDDQIATSVSASVGLREIAGQLSINGYARPGVDLAVVEAAIDEELARFIQEGPTPQELERVKTQHRASFIRGIERIGGFGGKSDVLAMNQVYAGSSDAYKLRLERVANATAEDLRGAAERWLSDGQFVLEVHPFPQHQAMASTVDRSTGVPEAGPAPTAVFPEMQRATLSNGLKVVLAERHAVPVVNMRLMVDAGFAADQFGVAGTANLAMAMLDEGTTTRSALEISEELASLGANVGAGSNLDVSTVSMSALSENLDASLDVFADVILNPAFPDSELGRLKQQTLAQIQQEKASPTGMALRVFAPLLYGDDHAYGNPMTGSGTEATVSGLTRNDLIAFHRAWFKPDNATLVVVGATSLDQILPKLEERFAEWRSGDSPNKNLATVAQQPEATVYIMDRPGAQQSVIFAGHLAPPQANPNEIAIEAMNAMLGGDFTSRVNMNLREDKHWSYGAATILFPARGQRPFIVYAPVQTDKTSESLVELQRELTAIRGETPPTAEELERVKKSSTLTLPGQWETAGAVAGSIQEIVQYGYDEDHFSTYADKIRNLGLEDVSRAARDVLHPEGLVWVVIGDRAVIEDGIRGLGLGKVYLMDADGNVTGVLVS